MKHRHISRQLLSTVVLLAVILVYSNSAVWAKLPEPKSGGKFARGKGTRYEYSYQGRTGGPVYDYGRGFQVGEAHIRPFVQYIHEWDNNVFYEENGRQEDNIDRLTGGATVELPIDAGQHVLYGGYIGNVEWFNRFTSEDHTDHTATGGLKLNLLPYSLYLENVFQRTTDRPDTEFTSRTKRDENSVEALLEVPFAQFFLETEINDFDVDYRDEPLVIFDHHTFKIYQRAGIDVAPSTQGLVEYAYMDIDYSGTGDRNGDAHEAALGVRGFFLGERLTYDAWVGAQWRGYNVESQPDYNGVVVRSGLLYDITDVSYVTLKFRRRPRESTFIDSFYVQNRFEFRWRQQVYERLFFNTSEGLDYNEYSRNSTSGGDSETRRDYVWHATLGLEYILPNDLVSIFVEYGFNARESNTALLDYDAQSVRFGVRTKF